MNKFKLDTHMHFDLYKSKDEVLDYVENNKSYTIAVTNLPEVYERYLGQYSNRKYVQIALGFHPELAAQFQSQLRKFDYLLKSTRFIGEIGLDYTTKDINDRRAQEVVFKHIIDKCNDSGNKILTVHSRRAEKNVLEILDNLNRCVVIMHWYSGPVLHVSEALDRGYYFSINHQMLCSENGKRIINKIPPNRILLESDAPFTKGLQDRYILGFMDEIYSYLCELYNMSEEELANQLKNNFRQVLTKYQE